MRPIVLAIAFALAMPVAATAVATTDWKEYRYPAYSFSVSFPAEPKVETATYPAPDGRAVEARVYSVALGNAAFIMTVVDLPNAASEDSVVIAHAIRTLAQRGEIKLNIPQRIARVFGREVSLAGTDGSHSTVAVFFYKGRLYQIEGRALGEDGNADAARFVQSLMFTDKANAAWPALVQRFRSECLRQFQYLRGPGQAENVREHVRGCVMAKVQAEVGKAAAERAGGAP